IENLSLRNFKAFRLLDNLPLLPLTVFCGANSSGKSSILQSLLLWKQSLEHCAPGAIALLNGPLVRLGSLSNITHGHDSEASVELGLSIIPSEPKRYSQNSYKVTFGLRDPSETGVFGTAVTLLEAELKVSAHASPVSTLKIIPVDNDLYRIRWN